MYGISESHYHIIARRAKELILFETPYQPIDIDRIKLPASKQTKSSLQFEDGINTYSYNYSKSTLYQKFTVPQNAFKLPVEILADPYNLILGLFKKDIAMAFAKEKSIKGLNYVVLPLYGMQDKQKFVFEKSGLNQWNADGRKRDPGEIYIPVPIKIHQNYPDFFPPRYQEFNLKVPTGEVFKAKICQENGKGLMTNPNKALSDWLLRKALKVKEGQLATITDLNRLGFDSVIITKDDANNFRIDTAKTDSYEEFMNLQ